MRLILPDARATHQVGCWLGEIATPGTVILLSGELGSGKTCLVQGLGRGLGITESIVSPTFTLVCEYLEGRLPLYHLDLYRLSCASVEQLHPEGYWQAEETPPGVTAIEWPERLVTYPDSYLALELDWITDQGRQVSIRVGGSTVGNYHLLLHLLQEKFLQGGTSLVEVPDLSASILQVQEKFPGQALE